MSTRANYWLLVSPRASVGEGIVGGYVEARDGDARSLQPLRAGDGLVCYSPYLEAGRARACQRFTAVGRITSDRSYRAVPHRGRPRFHKTVEYEPAREVPLWTLIDELGFIRDEHRWDRARRSGLLVISEADFVRIRSAMGSGVPALNRAA